VVALDMLVKPYAGSGALFHGLPVSFDGARAGGTERAPKIGEHNGQ
jgi:formyl-CoA transferase